jgi:hypothetical protein
MKTYELLDFLQGHPNSKPQEIADGLGISRQYIHRELKKLVETNQVNVIGSSPATFYSVNSEIPGVLASPHSEYNPSDSIPDYLYVSPSGQLVRGIKGFKLWCADPKRNLDPATALVDYMSLIIKYEDNRKDGFFDATSKLKSSFEKAYLNKLLYLELYSIEQFGRTRMGNLVLYAKQSQNKKLMQEIVDITKERLQELIDSEQIDAVLYVPPTELRKSQLMKFLEQSYAFRLPHIEVVKGQNQIRVAQKTLSTISERIENARQTFVVRERGIYRNVLLIDDAVGSGATMNDIAAKLRQHGTATGNIIGVALAGSLKGFEVIQRA